MQHVPCYLSPPIQAKHLLIYIGVASITQVTHVRNKNSILQGRSLNVIFHTRRERIRSLWEQKRERIFSFKRSSHLKRDAIEENHCLIQYSPFDVRNVFSIQATPLTINITDKMDCAQYISEISSKAKLTLGFGFCIRPKIENATPIWSL